MLLRMSQKNLTLEECISVLSLLMIEALQNASRVRCIDTRDSDTSISCTNTSLCGDEAVWKFPKKGRKCQNQAYFIWQVVLFQG
jgi:hypothetical protein